MHRLFAIAVWGLYMSVVGVVAYSQGVETMKAQAERQISDVASRLEIELDKFRTLPKVLVLHPAVKQVLENPSPDIVAEVNRLLRTYNESLSSDAVFLVSSSGVTLASSNWNQPDSFIGNDYSFRPYFQHAISGNEGNYFALGTVSGKRGYYFSSPVRKQNVVVGVLVIKVGLTVLENRTADQDFELLLTDNHGAIFYSSYAQWNYTALVSLEEEVEEEMIRQRQYGAGSMTVLTDAPELDQLLSTPAISLPHGAQHRSYMVADKEMKQVGWHLLALTPVRKVYVIVLWALLLATIIFGLVFLLSVYWRRSMVAQRQLAAINEQLEQRVEQRTAQLQQTNSTLVATIEKQSRTEQRLKDTQNELIQAGKLALLGELSASINHELNQPLTALRTYSETLLLMIQKGKTDALEQTTEEVIKLTRMMAKIVAQYKLFARKSAGKVGPVLLAETIHASLSILESKIQKMRARIVIEQPEGELMVLAESVPLEQVLVNLINNALQAQEKSEIPGVHIAVKTCDIWVSIVVHDNGPGLENEDPEQVFEPFYTTKARGLGLGLTISQRIIGSFKGVIQAANHPDGGAVFTVKLPKSKLEIL